MKYDVMSLRRLLPQGRTLPEAEWRRRHLGLLVLLWAHAAAVPIYAAVRGYRVDHVVTESALLPVAGLVASFAIVPKRVQMVAVSFGLLTASGILVHLSGGLIEMHFHFFVMVAVVALYQDWLPFLGAIAYVLIHHGVFGVLDPDSVFNHPAAQNNPWKWAGIHAAFVGAISVACLVGWRLNETQLEARRQAEERLRGETEVVERLHEIGRTLAAELDLQTVLQHVTDTATQLTAAAFGAFFYNVVDESGESYLLYTISGVPREAFSGFGMPRNTAVFAPTFAGEGVVRLDDVTVDAAIRSEPAAPRAAKGTSAGAQLPGCAGQVADRRSPRRTVLRPSRSGAIQRSRTSVWWWASQPTPRSRSTMRDLYESERRTREAAEAARRRVSLLADAGRALSASLDVDRTLADLARLVTPEVADSCVIYLVAEDGFIVQSVAYAGPGKPRAGDVAFDPLDPDHPSHPVAQVVRTGESQLIESIPSELVDASLDDGPERELVHRLGADLGGDRSAVHRSRDRRRHGTREPSRDQAVLSTRPISSWRRSSLGEPPPPLLTPGCTHSNAMSPRRSSTVCFQPYCRRSPASRRLCDTSRVVRVPTSVATGTTSWPFPMGVWRWQWATWSDAASRLRRSWDSCATRFVPWLLRTSRRAISSVGSTHWQTSSVDRRAWRRCSTAFSTRPVVPCVWPTPATRRP